MNSKLDLSIKLPSASQSPLIFPQKADGQDRSLSLTSSLLLNLKIPLPTENSRGRPPPNVQSCAHSLPSTEIGTVESNGDRQEPPAHTQNSVNRPQNKHLKPFKSRAELGGQLDPRINVGGRPKLLREETAKALAEIDEQGVTKARRIVDSMVELAQKQLPHSVTAFDKLCKIMEAGAEEQSKDRPFDISQLNPNILAAMKWAARSEK